MNLKRKFHRDLNRYQTPASPIAETHPATPLRPRKKWLTAPVAVAMAILLTCGAAAAGVTVAQYLNRDIITENTLRLSEVPEGYVGIYSAADLVQMAEDIENGTGADKYILMSDITFTDADYAEGGICEGGWVPLDTVRRIGRDKPTAEYPSAGYSIIHALEIFHGNGHVIRNLRINAPSDTDTDRYVGLFGNTNAEIIHLGIADLVDDRCNRVGAVLPDHVTRGVPTAVLISEQLADLGALKLRRKTADLGSRERAHDATDRLRICGRGLVPGLVALLVVVAERFPERHAVDRARDGIRIAHLADRQIDKRRRDAADPFAALGLQPNAVHRIVAIAHRVAELDLVHRRCHGVRITHLTDRQSCKGGHDAACLDVP